MRIRHARLTTPFFDYLLCSPTELADLLDRLTVATVRRLSRRRQPQLPRRYDPHVGLSRLPAASGVGSHHSCQNRRSAMVARSMP